MNGDGRSGGTRLVGILLLGSIALQGCFNGFTESDDGDSSKFLSGRFFVVSLPASDEARVPQIQNGAVVRFLGFKKDGIRDIFEFKAAEAGMTDIKIPKEGNPAGPFYTFTAKVVLGGVNPY
jgi:hypothetical protein